MSYADHDLRLHVAPDAHVHVLSAKGDRELGLAESFALGWSLVQKGQHAAAMRVFAALARQRPTDTQLLTMLAECQAAVDDYEASSDVLRSVFGGDDETIARLQSAFDAVRHGLLNRAIVAIESVARKFPELPLFHLLLGHLHTRAGRPEQALIYWRAAVAADQPDGYVRFVAQKLLAHASNSQRP